MPQGNEHEQKSVNALRRMIEEHGPDALFAPEGIRFVEGALIQLKVAGRIAASTVRFPMLRDKIPSHIRVDILDQAYGLIEMTGRCNVVLLLFKGYVDQQDCGELKKIFAGMYINACDREEGLRKLCKLTFDTYAEDSKDYSKFKTSDKDF